MKRNLTLILLLLQAMFFSLVAQTVLTRFSNEIHVGDVISLKTIDTISPGSAGPNQLWDYFSANILDDFVINCNADDTKGASAFSTYFASDENGDRTSYIQSTPTQRLYYGLKTDKVTINFTQPIVELTFPFAYGDEINGEMIGTYTEKGYTVPITGTHKIKADAWGTLILPNGVQLDNVLRVTSTREYDQEYSGSDYHFTVKRYAFYAPNQRYSVLQIKEVIYDCVNCACDGTQYKALFNAELRSAKEEELANSTRFQYKVYPNPFEREMKIEYSMEKSARIKINLVDMMGREVKQILDTTQEPGSYTITTDMSSYHASNFILRMQVNDILYTEKLIKKEGCQQH